MSDIGLFWDSINGAADFSLTDNDLTADETLESAIMLSLFVDRRADDGDVLPYSETDRRGWWADAVPSVEGDKIGSKLWLLQRSKQTADTLARAAQYAREALQWLIEDGVAERVDVESEIVAHGIMGLKVTVTRPTVDSVTYRYQYTWAAQEARRV